MTASAKTSMRQQGARRQEARSPIARLLHAHYESIMGEGLPSELKNLVVQCLAVEARKHGSTERAVEVLQLAIVQPAPSAKQ